MTSANLDPEGTLEDHRAPAGDVMTGLGKASASLSTLRFDNCFVRELRADPYVGPQRRQVQRIGNLNAAFPRGAL